MRAAYYETNGPARDVLRLAEVETPQHVAGRSVRLVKGSAHHEPRFRFPI